MKLIKNYIYYTLYQVISLIVPLILNPYITRVLTKDAIGIYSYVNSITQIIIIIGLLGLNTYSIREIAKVRENEKEVAILFKGFLLMRIFICCLLITGVMLFLIIANTEYNIYFMINFILIIANFIDISYYYTGIENMKKVVIKNTLIKLSSVILIVCFIKNDNDLFLYFIINSFSTLLGSLLMFKSLPENIFKYRINISEFNYIFHIKQSLKIFLPQIASQVYVSIDKIMIGLFLIMDSLAIYEKSEQIAKMPISIITALSTIMMPRIANEIENKNNNNVRKLMDLSIEFVFLVMIPIMFGFIAISNEFIPLYLGIEYTDAIFPFQLFCLLIFPISISSVFGNQYLVAKGKTKILSISYFTAALINIILNVIFLNYIGMIGAIYSTIIAECIVAIIQFIYVKNVLDKHLIAKFFISIASATLMSIIVTSFDFGFSWIAIFIKVFIGIIIYYVCLIVLSLNIIKFDIIQISIKYLKNIIVPDK